MSIKKKDIPLILLIFWLIVWNFGITEFANYYSVNIAAWVIRFLAIGYVLMGFTGDTKVKRINFVVGTISIILLLYYCVRTQNTRYFDTLFFLFTLRNIDYKRIINIVFKTQMAIVVVTVASSLLHIIPNELVLNAGRYRHNLGYIYCSYAANMFFFTVAHYFASKKRSEKISLPLIAIFLIINQVIFYYTDTKASYWGTLLLIAVEFILSKLPITYKPNKTKEWLTACIFPGFAILSVLTGLKYDSGNSTWALINTISSGRIYMASLGLERYGIRLLGNDLSWSTDHTSEYLYVDSSYVNILLTLGLIFLVVICIGFARVSMKSIKNYDGFLTIALLFVAIHCFTDPQLLDLRYNGFILLCTNLMLLNETNIEGNSGEANEIAYSDKNLGGTTQINVP